MHEHITIKKTGVCVAVDTGPALQRRARYAKHTSDSGPEKNGRDNNRYNLCLFRSCARYDLVLFCGLTSHAWFGLHCICLLQSKK